MIFFCHQIEEAVSWFHSSPHTSRRCCVRHSIVLSAFLWWEWFPGSRVVGMNWRNFQMTINNCFSQILHRLWSLLTVTIRHLPHLICVQVGLNMLRYKTPGQGATLVFLSEERMEAAWQCSHCSRLLLGRGICDFYSRIRKSSIISVVFIMFSRDLGQALARIKCYFYWTFCYTLIKNQIWAECNEWKHLKPFPCR